MILKVTTKKIFDATCISLAFLTSWIQTSKPYNKRDQAVWWLECELGLITDPDCPVDGGWSPWGPWSGCRGRCDDLGKQRRTRKCNNPAPSDSGIPCSGPQEETQHCYLTNCTVDDYRKLAESDFTRNEAFRQLEAVPALMERCLLTECPYDGIEQALARDNTWQVNPDALWNAMQCVKRNLGCRVVGEWGAWGSWSLCGARCGEGMRWRIRKCDAPPPSDARGACEGIPLQAEECEGDQCAIDVRDIERDATGTWSPWGNWSECSENCGVGVRRRHRTCKDSVQPRISGPWGTHCAGQHEDFELCERKECLLDGGWSGWSTWGPCTQTCGTGKRTRTRSCTRPVPAGGGANCIGPKTEIGSCYNNPCETYSHDIALFDGDSLIHYNFVNKRSALFHFYVRFMPLSPHGTLVRRGTVHMPRVRLSIQKWHVCLDAGGSVKSCILPRVCSPNTLEPGAWHTALVTVTSDAATLRVDDSREPIKATFPCDPELSDDKMNILVGERFHGGIQEMLLNFMPLQMDIDRKRRRSEFVPSSVSNVVYEKAGMEEAYLPIDNDQYLRLPCFTDQNEWQLELTFKSKRESGTILFLWDDITDNWLHVALQNMRLKLEIAMGHLKSESNCFTEIPPDQWIDVELIKKKESNILEILINDGEKLHVLLNENRSTARRRVSKSNAFYNKFLNLAMEATSCMDGIVKMKRVTHKPATLSLCNDEFFIGGIPEPLKNRLSYEFTPFTGVIASISTNKVLQDLYDLNVERFKDSEVQVSSRTASISGSYHETTWGDSNRLNLTCLHARSVGSPAHNAHWLFLDTTLTKSTKGKPVRSIDDGKVLRLVASAANNIRGFYTCRTHVNKRTHNIVTYGVLGKFSSRLTSPDLTTMLAAVTTIALIISTLTWLVVEGIDDLRNGYGFYRDAHLTPEEEADAVCKYIDDNMDLVGSESAAKMAKARARRKAQMLASRSNFKAQEPQGLNQIEETVSSESETSEPEVLPPPPEPKNFTAEVVQTQSHEVYRCEMSYVSSPRHGSILTTPRKKLTSSSSFESTSPRFLCSRLLLPKRLHSSSSETLRSTKNKSPKSRNLIGPLRRSNLLTITSSTYVEMTPAQRILQKFQQLRNQED